MLARRAFYFHLRYFLFTLQRLRSAPYLPGPLTDCWGSCSMPSGVHVFHSLHPSAVLDIQLFCFVFMCFLYALSDWLRLLRLDGQEVKEQVPGTHTRKNLTILISSLSQNMHTHAQTAAQEQPNRQNKNKKRKKKLPSSLQKFFFFL